MSNKSSSPTQADDRRLYPNPQPRSERFTIPRRRPRLCHLDRSHPQRLSYPSLCFMRVSRLCSSLRFSRCWGNSGSTDISRTTGVPPRWAMETIWIPKVESLLRHRESSGDASVRLAVARMCLVAVALDDQPRRHRSHPPLHAFRGHFTPPLTLAATPYYDCPYQTPPSILARTAIKYLKCNDAAVVRSLRSLIPSLPSIKNLR